MTNDSAAREMTLDEVVDRLPPTHSARSEYARLRASAGAVPEGWQLVPKVPTEDMTIAGLIANRGRAVSETYRAMLAAALAPSPDTKGENTTPFAWCAKNLAGEYVFDTVEPTGGYRVALDWEPLYKHHAVPQGAEAKPVTAELADWSVLPRDLYVVSARSVDGIGFDVATCSVPMMTVPEVRYIRADLAAPTDPAAAKPAVFGIGTLVVVPTLPTDPAAIRRLERERCAKLADRAADAENALYVGSLKRGERARAEIFRSAREMAVALAAAFRAPPDREGERDDPGRPVPHHGSGPDDQ